MGSSTTLALLICLAFGAMAEDTPVLLWSSEPLVNTLPEVENLEPMPTTRFHDGYLSPLLKTSEHSIVVFLQDKLHVDDFTKYADVYALNSAGGAFKNIKQLMEDNFSLEIPQVVKPHLALDKLKESFSGDVHSVSSIEELKPLELSSGKRFLLVVNLNPLADSVDTEKIISQNDEMIGNVAQHLGKIGIKYTALFTGKRSVDSQDAIEVHAGRHLLADEGIDSNNALMNVSGILLYLVPNVTVCVKDTKATGCSYLLEMTPTNHSADTSTNANGTAKVILHFDDVRTKGNESKSDFHVDIKFNLKKNSSHWVIQSSTLSVQEANPVINEEEIKADGVDTMVPLPFSFHCTDFILAITNITSSYKGSYARLRGFQLQAFNTDTDRFFNAQDCVGFFTTGIWMGLVPAALLLMILLWGTLMLLDLSINDRFDDPKRKTITVASSE